MASRTAAKSKKPGKSKAEAPVRGSAAKVGRTAAGSEPQVEIDRLRAELASARKRIAELEAQHENLVNRIDWAIDSLHSLIEE